MGIQVQNISKKFGDYTALDAIDLQVPSGELVALLGPSGSGKTTLLRIIAGLETPDSGSIHFDGEETTQRRVRERQVGFVFQHYALFRHMTVFDNIAFGMTVKPRAERQDKAHIRKRVNELLHLIQLDNMADRYPSQLSGGQRQRVAIARAIMLRPKLLVLDEPVSALDLSVQAQILNLLADLQDEMGLTYVFISHDLSVVRYIADKVMVMYFGEVVEYGTRDEVFDNPQHDYTKTLFAATPRADVESIRKRLVAKAA